MSSLPGVPVRRHLARVSRLPPQSGSAEPSSAPGRMKWSMTKAGARSQGRGAATDLVVCRPAGARAGSGSRVCSRSTLGGPDAPLVSFRVKDYAAYFRAIRKRFLEWVQPRRLNCRRQSILSPTATSATGITAAPKSAATSIICRSLRASPGSSAARWSNGGVPTLAARSATWTSPEHRGSMTSLQQRSHRITTLSADAVERSAAARSTSHELLQPVVADQGLAALPEPSPGDLFLDLEGDPYAFELGIEVPLRFRGGRRSVHGPLVARPRDGTADIRVVHGSGDRNGSADSPTSTSTTTRRTNRRP